MTFYRGEQGSVKFHNTGATTVAVAGTRSWSLTLEKEVLNVDTLKKKYSQNIGGTISGTGTAEVIYSDTAEQTHEFVDMINKDWDEAAAQFELLLVDGKFVKFKGIINSAEINSTIGELTTITVGFTTHDTITTGY